MPASSLRALVLTAAVLAAAATTEAARKRDSGTCLLQSHTNLQPDAEALVEHSGAKGATGLTAPAGAALSKSLLKNACNAKLNGKPKSELADHKTCEFVCPCCPGFTPPKMLLEQESSTNASQASEEPKIINLGSQVPGGDPLVLIEVPITALEKGMATSAFQANLMTTVQQKMSLKEFYEKKRVEHGWPEWDKMIKSNGGLKKPPSPTWNDEQLAIWMYTAETPGIYKQMNWMLRTAKGPEAIGTDGAWESFMAILGAGLKKYASYSLASTFRGVDLGTDCSDDFRVGKEYVQPQWISTTTDEKVIFNFDANCEVRFVGNGGYNLAEYSASPGEAELLQEPGRVFKVTKITKGLTVLGHSGLTVIETELQSPATAMQPSKLAPPPKADCNKIGGKELCPVCECCGI